jgi:hypothetical protein
VATFWPKFLEKLFLKLRKFLSILVPRGGGRGTYVVCHVATFDKNFGKNFFGNFKSFVTFWCHVVGEGVLTWSATWPLFGQIFGKTFLKTLKVFVNFGATWWGKGSLRGQLRGRPRRNILDQ